MSLKPSRSIWQPCRLRLARKDSASATNCLGRWMCLAMIALFAAPALVLSGAAAQSASPGKSPGAPQKNPAVKKNVDRGVAESGPSQKPGQKQCYAVQVGAYESRDEAVAVENALSRQFRNATQMAQLPSPTKTLWRVRLLAASKEEAAALVKRLQKTDWNKSWVVPTACG